MMNFQDDTKNYEHIEIYAANSSSSGSGDEDEENLADVRAKNVKDNLIFVEKMKVQIKNVIPQAVRKKPKPLHIEKSSRVLRVRAPSHATLTAGKIPDETVEILSDEEVDQDEAFRIGEDDREDKEWEPEVIDVVEPKKRRRETEKTQKAETGKVGDRSRSKGGKTKKSKENPVDGIGRERADQKHSKETHHEAEVKSEKGKNTKNDLSEVAGPSKTPPSKPSMASAAAVVKEERHRVKEEKISNPGSSPGGAGGGANESLDETQRKIIQLCVEYPKGINDAVIQNELPDLDVKGRASAINGLLVAGKIDIFKQGTGLLYRLKDKAAADGLKNADNQEKVIYQIIASAGNKGIWSRDIRFKSNLPLTQVNKMLKNLEAKKLVKSVKSVAAAKKKVYMLFDVEPDRSVTGGSWYSDQDFESEFVQILHQQCLKFLKQKIEVAVKMHGNNPMAQKSGSFVSSKEMWNFINDLGISKVKLSMEDIEMILETLIFDGSVEKEVIVCSDPTSLSGQMNIYRAVRPLVPVSPLMQTPCGICPVFDKCHPGGAISPQTCIYMKEWLDL